MTDDAGSKEVSESVPAPVKRQLRQEAGFGCCKCGLPIIEYHHIIPLASERHHRPEDMMVLCPTHHGEADSAMTDVEQRKLKAHPINVLNGHVDGCLSINQDYLAVDMGVVVINEGTFLDVDGEALIGLSLKEGRLLVSAALYDENDEVLALIDENEWIAGDKSAWDIESKWKTLVIRAKMRDIRLNLDARGDPLLLRGVLYKGGNRIEIKAETIEMYPQAIVLGPGMGAVDAHVSLSGDTAEFNSTIGKGVLVFAGTRKELLAKARRAYKENAAKRG